MNIISHLKQYILKEIFDKKVELDWDSFEDYGEIDQKVYHTNVNGESYDFDFAYSRDTKFITINFKPSYGHYNDMPNDNRVFDVLAKIKFFLKSYLDEMVRIIELDKKVLSDANSQEYEIKGFKFLPIPTAGDEENKVDVMSRKRTKLYMAFFKKTFSFNLEVKTDGSVIYFLFDKPMSPEKLLALL